MIILTTVMLSMTPFFIAHFNLNVYYISWAHAGISLPHYNVFQDHTCWGILIWSLLPCSGHQFPERHADLEFVFYGLNFWGTLRQSQSSTMLSAHMLNIFLAFLIINRKPEWLKKTTLCLFCYINMWGYIKKNINL